MVQAVQNDDLGKFGNPLLALVGDVREVLPQFFAGFVVDVEHSDGVALQRFAGAGELNLLFTISCC